ncbi:MAG: zinc ribbon domain-containing protein [Ectothiorhodospiraceae bacterium AqS1]|nr:zinc ribbon domain-containing protein [Ectothiorhodospiraceae bacterium AqS1]
MPIYEYECAGCGKRHEFIQKFSDPPKRKCPACGKSKLKKLISAAAFHLKGDGWYVTDFKDGGKKKPDAKAGDGGGGEKSSTTDDSSASTSDAKKSDSKKSSSDDSGKKASKKKGGPSKAA